MMKFRSLTPLVVPALALALLGPSDPALAARRKGKSREKHRPPTAARTSGRSQTRASQPAAHRKIKRFAIGPYGGMSIPSQKSLSVRAALGALLRYRFSTYASIGVQYLNSRENIAGSISSANHLIETEVRWTLDRGALRWIFGGVHTGVSILSHSLPPSIAQHPFGQDQISFGLGPVVGYELFIDPRISVAAEAHVLQTLGANTYLVSNFLAAFQYYF